MIQLQVCFCLLGLALAALGVAMLLRPQRLRRALRRLDAGCGSGRGGGWPGAGWPAAACSCWEPSCSWCCWRPCCCGRSTEGGGGMNYRLIPMERAHLPQAAELERQCFSDPWTEAQLAGELDNELLSLSAAVGEDGTVLGYAEVRVILDEGTLERIAVAPRYRRQGIAEALLDAYIQYGREHLAFLTLEVRAGNAPAIALYEKLGFREVGRRKNYYRAEHEDALLMTVEFDRHG